MSWPVRARPRFTEARCSRDRFTRLFSLGLMGGSEGMREGFQVEEGSPPLTAENSNDVATGGPSTRPLLELSAAARGSLTGLFLHLGLRT